MAQRRAASEGRADQGDVSMTAPQVIQCNEGRALAPFQVTFTVQGEPKGQPRPRAFAFHGRARVYDPGTAEAWKSLIAFVARPHIPMEPLTGPVAVELHFHMPRPKAHSGRHGIKPNAPKEHTGKPDADNLAKAVLDAMTTIGFWRDDSQVSDLKVRKIYSLTPGAVVTVTECREVEL